VPQMATDQSNQAGNRPQDDVNPNVRDHEYEILIAASGKSPGGSHPGAWAARIFREGIVQNTLCERALSPATVQQMRLRATVAAMEGLGEAPTSVIIMTNEHNFIKNGRNLAHRRANGWQKSKGGGDCESRRLGERSSADCLPRG
jgi:ribonuclease HI